ncbi:MAG: RNA-dependent RNA polymerase [Sanya levivirus 5]|nr:MAG: RNA-dependent RNA polymerase [Sanya levivirus 5]
MKLFAYDPNRGCYIVAQDPDPVSLYQIRQACEYLYKLALPFSEEQLAKALLNFLEVDAEVLDTGDYDEKFVDAMRKNFETFYPTCARLTLSDIAREAHPGNGTFSEPGERFWERNAIEPTVPSEMKDFRFGLRFNKSAPNPKLCFTDPDYSQVLFVPKDSRGPRTIVREPYSKLMFQMGFNSSMASALEKDTRHRVNFKDQTINQGLVHKSSIDRTYATIDLKDASDRVSYPIASHLFRHTPLRTIFTRLRSRFCQLPNKELHRLKKLAGMGSGFTFPTMSLVIHLAICTHVSKRLGIPYSTCMRKCFVYGDDIIVPTHWVSFVIVALNKVGLVVNKDKSFYRSKFRESCGCDFYNGNDVTPVRLKMQNSQPKLQGLTLSFGSRDFAAYALDRHARQLDSHQLYKLRDYIYSVLESSLGKLPYVVFDSPIIGRVADRDTVFSTLKTDDTGAYVKERLWQPTSIDAHVKNMCPYRYLLRRFSKVGNQRNWYEDLFPLGRSSSFGSVTVPRKLKLRKVKTSSFKRT